MRFFLLLGNILSALAGALHPVIERCPDCHKPTYILGQYVGDHNNCMPF